VFVCVCVCVSVHLLRRETIYSYVDGNSFAVKIMHTLSK